MKQIPKIEELMAPMPHCINQDLPLKKAKEMMIQYSVRHLPVLEAGKLIGVVSDRDLKLALSLGENDQVAVRDIMTPEPYSVTPNTPLDIVLETMAERKIGSTIVQHENGKIQGIFTSVDGLKAFAQQLKSVSRK